MTLSDLFSIRHQFLTRLLTYEVAIRTHYNLTKTVGNRCLQGDKRVSLFIINAHLDLSLLQD